MTQYQVFTVNGRGCPVSNYCITTDDRSVIDHLIQYFKLARPNYKMSITIIKA